jgi:hypothetical protein
MEPTVVERARTLISCKLCHGAFFASFAHLLWQKNGFMVMKGEMKKELSQKQREELFKTLKARFEKNMGRHPGLVWAKVQSRLCGMEANAEKLWSLSEMERTGGEPDVVGQDKKSGEYVFFDCSAETPKGRTLLFHEDNGGRPQIRRRTSHRQEEALKKGMEEKSREFVEKGAEVYPKA